MVVELVNMRFSSPLTFVFCFARLKSLIFIEIWFHAILNEP